MKLKSGERVQNSHSNPSCYFDGFLFNMFRRCFELLGNKKKLNQAIKLAEEIHETNRELLAFSKVMEEFIDTKELRDEFEIFYDSKVENEVN
jgi:hypothetical protein